MQWARRGTFVMGVYRVETWPTWFVPAVVIGAGPEAAVVPCPVFERLSLVTGRAARRCDPLRLHAVWVGPAAARCGKTEWVMLQQSEGQNHAVEGSCMGTRVQPLHPASLCTPHFCRSHITKSTPAARTWSEWALLQLVCMSHVGTAQSAAPACAPHAPGMQVPATEESKGDRVETGGRDAARESGRAVSRASNEG